MHRSHSNGTICSGRPICAAPAIATQGGFDETPRSRPDPRPRHPGPDRPRRAAGRQPRAGPALPSAQDWTGFYLGGQIGWGGFDAEGAGLDVSDDAAFGRVHAGYTHDFGNFIPGGEAEVEATGLEGRVGAATGQVDRIARLKLRAGPDLGQSVVYGTVGLAKAWAEAAGTEYDDTGYTVGLGVDHRLAGNWVIGGELLYDRFGDLDKTGVDLSGLSLRVRASWRF